MEKEDFPLSIGQNQLVERALSHLETGPSKVKLYTPNGSLISEVKGPIGRLETREIREQLSKVLVAGGRVIPIINGERGKRYDTPPPFLFGH